MREVSNKRLVHVIIACFYREGQGYQENILPKKHKKLGFDTNIITWDNSKPQGDSYINKDGIPVRILPLNQSFMARTKGLRRWPHKRVIGLYEAIESINPDIIFVHGTDILDNRQVVEYVKRHPKVVCYADQHADYFNTPTNTLSAKFKINFFGKKTVNDLASVSKRLWGVTPWRVQYLHDVYGVPFEKLDLLHMGGDEDYIINKDSLSVRKLIRNEFNIPDEMFLIVTGGKIDRRKHQDLLMEAVSQRLDNNIGLLVFGAPDGEMESVVEHYKSCRNIWFAGWIPSERAYDMFMASDLAFFPGAHSVLWEQAVSCGIPIATQHWEGMEHINFNDNAIMIDSVNVDSILNTIDKCTDLDYYKDLYKRAHIAAPNYYYIEIAKRSLDL